uniref:Uncharacterized protein n=1 Tax=Melopsittacus undulatus TaxID=13146 RepID=A0A8V5GW31_MELUD
AQGAITNGKGLSLKKKQPKTFKVKIVTVDAEMEFSCEIHSFKWHWPGFKAFLWNSFDCDTAKLAVSLLSS